MPLLARGKTGAVLQMVEAAWPVARLRQLLTEDDSDVVASAAKCIGYVGTMRDCGVLTELLGAGSAQVVQAAEDALWSLWMRAGSADARAQLRVAMEKLGAGESASAARLLETLTLVEPHYGEAHHQLALARFEAGDVEGAAKAYRATLEENPHHYAALVGLGNLHIERDEFSAALGAYKAALRIHPGLTEIEAMVPTLQEVADARHVA